MAGFLPGESSYDGTSEGGSSRSCQDRQEEMSRWYMSRKEIEDNSPSRRDGIDLKRETYLRKSYCTFLRDLGMRLKVPQVTIATAIMFCHRFFLRQSHTKNDRRTIATVCMFLAGKVEETPRPLKDVILVSYEIIHKKDPTAAQRIKQKEVYEQQKEIILIGERVVLATLGFDLNIHHPYKPLVEAIKKFMVAKNALAKVAWNFVNDGLMTSLCLQFKPHHIAAGAIFLAAKFLKVKLPSDGEMIWWQEFQVNPRQLEEVSNQMLELYEQNRVPPSHGSVVEGSSVGGSSYCNAAKTVGANEEHTSKLGSFCSSPGHLSVIKNEVPLGRTQNESNDNGSAEEMGSVITDHKVEAENKDNQYNNRELPKRSMSGTELPEENKEKNVCRNETADMERKINDSLSYKSGGSFGQAPKEAIKIDRDKVKEAIERRRKSHARTPRKKDEMDEDDLIERELEEGVQLATKEEQSRYNKTNNRNHAKDFEEIATEEKSTMVSEIENTEEGEMVDDTSITSRSSSRKRKAESLTDNHLEVKEWRGYAPKCGLDG